MSDPTGVTPGMVEVQILAHFQEIPIQFQLVALARPDQVSDTPIVHLINPELPHC